MALQRSRRLLDALYDLRRAGALAAGDTPQEPSPPPEGAEQGAGSSPEAVEAAAPPQSPPRQTSPPRSPPTSARAGEETPLLVATLKDTQDTAESLTSIVDAMKEIREPIEELGGARHATSVVCMRTLAVLQRKRDLLGPVEERVRAFEATVARRDAILKVVLAGTGEAPPEMQGIGAFIRKYTHSPGEPVDADKSDFRSFLDSFGLPAAHKALFRLNQLGQEAAEWWAGQTLLVAQSGADAAAIKRLVDLVKNIGATKAAAASQACQEAQLIMGERLAEQVLKFAEECKAKDAFAVSRSDAPQVESARKCADEINMQIKEAVKLGAQVKHPCMEAGKVIATWFQMEEKNRIAQRALVFARQMKARDENMQQAAGPNGIVEVGAASTLADKIDEEIKKSEKEGAPAAHEALKEAKEISKALRDADGVRKRLKAREERQKKG